MCRKQREPAGSMTGMILLILCIVVILSGCSQAANQSGFDMKTASQQQETEEEEMDEQRVIARYQAVQQAMIDKDIDVLDEIILDGMTFTHMSGKTQTKDEYFADIRDGRLDYQSYTMKDAKVVIDGDDATLTCRVVLTANAYGAQGSWPFNVTAHLVRIDGEWYMTN
ncbi:MAG: nuclear transport factor 2 family protein [Lachnospiraceae bacterium]|nr:nuclear transport factor 2 family protein [Lachnospiraceae bacterium]